MPDILDQPSISAPSRAKSVAAKIDNANRALRDAILAHTKAVAEALYANPAYKIKDGFDSAAARADFTANTTVAGMTADDVDDLLTRNQSIAADFFATKLAATFPEKSPLATVINDVANRVAKVSPPLGIRQ